MKGIFVSSLQVCVLSITFFDDGGVRLHIGRDSVRLDTGSDVIPWVQKVFPAVAYIEAQEDSGDRYRIEVKGKRRSLL